MQYKHFLPSVIFTLATLSYSSIVNSAPTNWHSSITVGTGFSRVGSAQNIWLDITPEPGLENNFSSKGNKGGTFLLGFAVEKNFALPLKNIESSLGVQADYLRNPAIKGVVRPMVNVAPDFDTLNYTYDMSSYLLQARAKLNWTNILEHLGIYLQAGAGAALNELSNYAETSPPGSSAAPMLIPFGDRLTLRPAYSIGAGLSYHFVNSATFSIGYLYINTGSARLKTTPVQGTNETLNFSPLTSQLLTLTLGI